MKSLIKILLIGIFILVIDIHNGYSYEQINLSASINLSSSNNSAFTIKKAENAKPNKKSFKEIKYTNLPMPKHIKNEVLDEETYFNHIASFEIIKLNKRTKDSNRPIVIVHHNMTHKDTNNDPFSWIYKEDKPVQRPYNTI